MVTGILIAILLLILTAIYLYIKDKLRYFEKRGIDGPKPEFFFGNFRDCFYKRRHISYVIDDIYTAYKDTHPVVGFYNITTPYLLVTNADLVKQILIKDFRFFRNNEFSALVSVVLDPHTKCVIEKFIIITCAR
jgi:cytochrome P450 family 6